MEKGRVVVIDDSPIVRKLAQIALEEEGYTVYTAEDGEQGYKVAEDIRPSLILVDFIMPKVSGYQVCKMVRENEAIKDTPIILITGKGDEAGRKFTEKFGVLDYFVKPFRSEALIEKVNSILQPNEGISLDDVNSLATLAGDEPIPDALVVPVFERPDEAFGLPGYDQPPGFAEESPACLDQALEGGPGYDFPAPRITIDTEDPSAAGPISLVGLDDSEEPADLGFLTAEETPEALCFDSPLDLDQPVLLSQEGPAGDDGGSEVAQFLNVDDLREGLSDSREVSPETGGDDLLGIGAFPCALEVNQPGEELSLPEGMSVTDGEIPETPLEQPAYAVEHAEEVTAGATDDTCLSLPAEPAEETIQRIASQAVAACVDEKLSASLEGLVSRLQPLLDEILEGGTFEAAVERVLSRHFTTTLPSMLQDKTAEALTLLREPPAEADIERAVERVLSRHFRDDLSALIRETSADIRKDLENLPGSPEISATVESAISDSQSLNLLPTIEDKFAALRDDLKGFPQLDDIRASLNHALAQNFPEDFALSLKDGIARLIGALDELPRAADIEKAVEERLRGHLPEVVQSLLDQHAAEMTRHIGGLPRRSEIEGIMAGLTARNDAAELLPQFTRSLEDMLKQHGIIKAPGIILSGDAAHLDLAQVIGMATARGLTGRLSVYSVSLSSEMYLHEGTLCYASTSRQGRDPVLGRMLSADAGTSEELTPDARNLLQHRIRTALHDTLTIRDGKFYFEQGAIPEQLLTLPFRVDSDLSLADEPAGDAHGSPAGARRDNGEGALCTVAATGETPADE